MRYDLLVPPRTIFGCGRIAEVGSAARSLGDRALIVSGSRTLASRGILDDLARHLEGAGVEALPVGSACREPTVSDVDSLVRRARKLGAAPAAGRDGARDLIVGIGGGSALDLAKALAAMLGTEEVSTVRDCLEGVGRGVPVAAALPVLAVPTTAGTGSECTKNAVISSDPDESSPFKKSLRAPCMIPRAALIDPELASSSSAGVTARTGMDAITQLVEALLSRRAQPIPSALARHGLEIAVPAIERAVTRPGDLAAREAMAHAAYLSGIALANAGLGMAHGVAAALGVVAGIPHGLACALMLPAALEANAGARPRETEWIDGLLARAGRSGSGPAARARELARRLGLPVRLGDAGVAREQIPAIVARSRGNSMSGNPREIGDRELGEILERML